METNTDPAAVSSASLPGAVFGLIIGVLMIVALWKIFQKAGKPGWASIVPFYNTFTLFKIADLNRWLFRSPPTPSQAVTYSPSSADKSQLVAFMVDW